MGIDVRQYITTVEDFLALGNLYPMGKYKIASGDQPRRTTWFQFNIPINNMNLEVTWFIDHGLSESVWTEMAEELELI